MILDLQRRLAEVGRIRIGHQTASNGGKTRPEKLDTFRLTSPDKIKIEHASALFGGEVQPWQAPAGPQWEVITKTASLDVIVPPSDMAFSQHYELWSAGGCQRRCDGRNESISEGPCVCDPDERECDIHTRLSVMLRDLPGLGVWRLDTQGYYAATELQGAVQVIQLAAGRGQMLPARLRLEQRQVKRQINGKPQTRKFPVPVLDIEISPGQLMTPMVNGETGEIIHTPAPAMAPNLTPVPALPQFPVSSIADQVGQVDEEPRQTGRRSPAKPLPATGIRPRTAEEAAGETPPWEADGITKKQLGMIGALMKEQGLTDRDDALAYVNKALGNPDPPIKSRNDMSRRQASVVIDALQADGQNMIAALKAERDALAGPA